MTPEEVAERIIPRFQILLPEDAGGYRCEIADAIREAVAEERKRCAKEAENFSASFASLITDALSRVEDPEDIHPGDWIDATGNRIAARIREGGGE